MDGTHLESPKWSNTTKLIVGLTILGIFAFLFNKFQSLLAPLLLTFILVYLMYPPSNWFSRVLHLNWRLSVTVVFFILFLSIAGLLTWGGISLIDQGQSLLKFLEDIIINLPATLNTIVNTPITIGPFKFDMYHFNLNPIGSQITSTIQPLFGQIGSLLGTIATGAASFVGWFLFIMIMAYFILAETAGKPERIMYLDIPGYSEDFRRLGILLGRVWNAFLRGQILIIGFVILVYSILFGALGLRYFFGLAIIAGLARFLPYIGPFIAWTTYALVAYFQGNTLFGFSPFGFAVFIVGTAWLTDLIIDNFVATRVMANVLEVHPAAILIAALIGANLIGITGVILAAPVLATVELVFSYVSRKLFDLDPWEGIDTGHTTKPMFGFQSTMLVFFGKTWKILSDRLKDRNRQTSSKRPTREIK
jgi:predicted PurR-regulated permease PerM